MLCPTYGRTPSLLVAGGPLAEGRLPHDPGAGAPLMVTGCVCCAIAIADLRCIARLHNVSTIEALHEVAQFGEGCGLCLPYVSLMLRTGRVSFDPSEPFEDDVILAARAVAPDDESLSAPKQHNNG